MKFEDILKKDCIEVACRVKSKNELLVKMIDLASQTGLIINKDEALKDILEREKLMSTGIGKGIALPHAKTDAVKDTVGSLVILDEAVNFESLDGEPVKLAFMLLGRESNVGIHLRILSKISRILNNDEYKEEIMGLRTIEEVIEFFKRQEEEE